MATNLREWQWIVCLGRNGWDHPLAIPDDMASEVENIELIETGLGQKRRGSTLVSIPGESFAGAVALFNFIPEQDPSQAELWAATRDVPPKLVRMPNATAILATSPDPITSPPQNTNFCAFHGKLYIAFGSGVNRLHVYDPKDVTTPFTIRRAGLIATFAAIGFANFGSGSFPATLRYYRIQYIRRNTAGALVATSPLSAPTSFTPSGSGADVQVTVTVPIGAEPATHIKIFASTDGVSYFDISGEQAMSVPPTTFIYHDAMVPTQYTFQPAAPLEGAATPFPSVKYLATDGIHLLGFGVWESAAGDSIQPIPGRVYFTPALGSSFELGDDERVSNTVQQQGWIDARPNSGGVDRGLAGPLNDRFYVFQSDAIFMLAPTGSAVAPFARIILTTQYGAVSHKSIVMGEDEGGQPCLYFLNPADGPRRCTIGRTIDWCGKDVYDLWKTVDLDKAVEWAHGVYDARRKLVIWFVPQQGSTTPNLALVFDCSKGRTSALGVRYGWGKWTGLFANATASVMFSKTFPAPHSELLTPYVGPTVGASCLLKLDETTVQDNLTGFYSYMTSKAWDRGSLLQMKRILEAWIIARVAPMFLQQTLIKDWSEETRQALADLSQQGTETRAMRRFDPVDVADWSGLQIQLGDYPGGPNSVAWLLDRWVGGAETEPGKMG